MSARTLKALEKAAIRMVDRQGWILVSASTCDDFEKRRDDFETAVADHKDAASERAACSPRCREET